MTKVTRMGRTQTWRGNAAWLLGGLLALALASAPAAQVARADDPSYLSIFAPGASAAAPVGVQALTSAGWAKVATWQGYLIDATDRGTRFTRWPVDPAQLGQGPF